MSKGIIIVDIPECCENCLFHRTHAAPIQDHVFCTILTRGIIPKNQNKKPDWCPLNPIPEKQSNDNIYDEYYDGFDAGWNACIDEILKGE